MKLKGYHSEEELNQLLYDGKISRLQFVKHHSPVMRKQFETFCKKNGLEENEESANKFQDHLLEEEEQAHNDLLD